MEQGKWKQTQNKTKSKIKKNPQYSIDINISSVLKSENLGKKCFNCYTNVNFMSVKSLLSHFWGRTKESINTLVLPRWRDWDKAQRWAKHAIFREPKVSSVGLKQRRWKDSALRIGSEGLQGQIPQGTRKLKMGSRVMSESDLSSCKSCLIYQKCEREGREYTFTSHVWSTVSDTYLALNESLFNCHINEKP